MKELIIIIIVFSLIGCDGIHGWFPGYTDPQPTPTQPTIGCNKDLTVHYKNNCSKNLIMYFIEVSPNTTINCESLEDLGIIVMNETKTMIVHKGKLGYIVFAEDEEGKCTGGHRKAELYVNCELSTSDDAYFNVCN
jgi:hypothetical protein